MTSMLVAHLQQWLRTKPGPVRGNTSVECYEKAQVLAGLNGKVDEEYFARTLASVGYEPQQRTVHDETKRVYWILCLPEYQAGSRV